MSVKIRIISQYFSPDTASTGKLLSELATALASQNIEVSAITAFPTYNPSIKALRKEVVEKVFIQRIWSTRLNKNTMFGKVLNSASFFFSVLIRLLFSSSSAPLFIVTTPPFLSLVGVILRKLRKIPYIFLVYDVYPDIAVKLNYLSPNSFIVWFWNKLNKWVLHSASHIVVISEEMKNCILQKKITNENINISIIHNWTDGNVIKPISYSDNKFIRENNLDGKFIIQYSGNIGLFYKLETIIESAHLTPNFDILFMFIGEGGKKQKLQELVQSYNLSNVKFFPYQEWSMLSHSLSAANISIVTLDNNISGLTMPSKIYSLMAAGTPIIALCDSTSDVAKIITESQCGFVVEQDNAQELSQKIQEMKNNQGLLKTMGNNARKYFEQHFTLEKAATQYETIICSIQ